MPTANKLLSMMNGLNMPVAVSSSNGAIRAMEQRLSQIRAGQVQSMGSCQSGYSSWGN
ncbi:MAG: hypothetical protein P4N41_22550 [Negativicutes bacterium]|nr:hypothetical protein [Negativicutes bacterium]